MLKGTLNLSLITLRDIVSKNDGIKNIRKTFENIWCISIKNLHQIELKKKINLFSDKRPKNPFKLSLSDKPRIRNRTIRNKTWKN